MANSKVKIEGPYVGAPETRAQDLNGVHDQEGFYKRSVQDEFGTWFDSGECHTFDVHGLKEE